MKRIITYGSYVFIYHEYINLLKTNGFLTIKTGERIKVFVCCPQSNLRIIFIHQNILRSICCK